MGILTAFALIMVRSLSPTESPRAIAFYFVIASIIGGTATLPVGWVMPDWYAFPFSFSLACWEASHI